jgi:hypothetical protein
LRRYCALAFVSFVAVGLLAPGMARAQTVGGSCSLTLGSPDNLQAVGCVSGVWAVLPIQVGADVAGCSATTAGEIQWTGSALEYCNGSAWQSASASLWSLSGSNIFYSGGGVGVGTATPQSALQVYGAQLQVGSGGAACGSSNAGALRYASSRLQYCNGTSWVFVN